MVDEVAIGERFRAFAGELNERQRRLWAASEACAAGRGGVAATARATGISVETIRRGIAELESGERLAPGRVRRPGGGRKPLSGADRSLLDDLERLVDADGRGDPESLLRWTCKSVLHLAEGLRELGHQVHFTTVAQLLRGLGYSLQANVKTREGRQHPDRDAQFRHINVVAKRAVAQGQPVISVDSKKKELVGDFKNAGREWRPKGEPELVRVHDFKDNQLGKAIPYGVYEIGSDQGWVNVGIDHDTAQFAVNSIRSWWEHLGRPRYPHASTLQITADCGGSNGNRTRLWKVELQTARRRERARDRRLPPPARHLQVEPDRAPPVQLHHDQLARQTAHLARDDHQPDRRDHHQQRARGLRPPRPGHLPRQDQSLRHRPQGRQPPQRRVPPRIELPHQTKRLITYRTLLQSRAPRMRSDATDASLSMRLKGAAVSTRSRSIVVPTAGLEGSSLGSRTCSRSGPLSALPALSSRKATAPASSASSRRGSSTPGARCSSSR